MTSNLIPQKRMDKTGKLVTRHVRAGAPKPASGSSLPAPKMAVPNGKKVTAKKPLAKQSEVKLRMGSRSNHSPDPSLYAALGADPKNLWDLTTISASDVQMYDMFSILRTDDAVLLMDHKITSPDDAVELLEKNGLSHLLIDRRDLMTEAQNRRIDAWNFMEAQHKFGVDDLACDPEVLLGAVRLDDSISLPRWETGGKEDSYAHHVMRGDISYDDVMTLGISSLSGAARFIPEQLCGYLKDIHTGRASYDAELLRHLGQKSGYSRPVLEQALGMVSEYGADFMSKVTYLDSAIAINDQYRGRPTKLRAELIQYAQEMELKIANIGYADMVKLFDNDIPVEDAKVMVSQGMDADRIIAVSKEGITKSVASGWL